MSWLEHRLGHLAIPGLLRIIVGFNILVFALLEINPSFYYYIDLQPDRVLGGEVWRLLSYIFIPPVVGDGLFRYMWMFFAASLMWLMADGLEQAWGPFRLNVFYFLGMLGCTVAAFFADKGAPVNPLLNGTVFLAFATIYPKYELRLMLVLPVEVRWLALLQGAGLLAALAFGSAGTKILVLVSTANYLLFFGPVLVRYLKRSGDISLRRAEFEGKKVSKGNPLHECKVCRRTDRTNPELEFRVGPDGEDYCNEHEPTGSPAR